MPTAWNPDNNPIDHPENFRPFALGKLIRLGIVTHAVELGGFIFARHLSKNITFDTAQKVVQAALIAHLRKIREEFQEVEECFPLKPKGNDNLAEEMADFMDAVACFRQELLLTTSKHRTKLERKLKRNKKTINPVLIQKLDHLEQLLQRWPNLPLDLSVVQLDYLATHLEAFIIHLMAPVGGAVTRESFESAREEKNRSKGPMTGLYADIIVLPRAQTKWCAHLAERFPEINPELLDYSRVYNA